MRFWDLKTALRDAVSYDDIEIYLSIYLSWSCKTYLHGMVNPSLRHQPIMTRFELTNCTSVALGWHWTGAQEEEEVDRAGWDPVAGTLSSHYNGGETEAKQSSAEERRRLPFQGLTF